MDVERDRDLLLEDLHIYLEGLGMIDTYLGVTVCLWAKIHHGREIIPELKKIIGSITNTEQKFSINEIYRM